MVGPSIGLTTVLPRVGQYNLARSVIMVNGEKGLFPVVFIGHDNGVEGVVVKFRRRFIDEVDMGIAHEFKFGQAQGLFSDSTTDDVLFHSREAVGEEGDKFHCQIGGAPEVHGS